MNNNNIIHEKKHSVNIAIPEKNNNETNYEVNCNILDPNKSSPPNYFLHKLLIRLNNLQQTNIEKRF